MNYASEERAGEPWRGHRRQAHDLWRCESENVAHVQLHPSRQGPTKAVLQLRHPELQRVQTQLHPGARPPPGPERQVPEVATPPDDEVCIGEEPRRPEHFGVLNSVFDLQWKKSVFRSCMCCSFFPVCFSFVRSLFGSHHRRQNWILPTPIFV
jgi:hypothetical protein